jgi:1-phosphofructokinase/tagatose 6-phosphate kinase
MIDTDGAPLRRAVRAEPDVISPNVLESEELVGHEFNDDEDRMIAVREMCELGARQAIMTMPDGCFAQMIVKDVPEPVLYRVRVRAGAIEPRATVGSGDAFLAGFVAALPAPRRRRARLRRAAAPSPRSTSARASSPDRVGGCSPSQVERPTLEQGEQL